MPTQEPPRYVQNLQSRQFVDRRRGHNQQLPLNDNAHHVTEAIGGMYDEEGHERHRHPRPLSFAPSQLEEGLERKASQVSSSRLSPTDSPLSKSISSERSPKSPSTSPTPNRPRQTSISDSTNGPASPSLSRSPSASTANQAFPLNDIDYESSPAAVAQELSNLQAIRRMSMNVDAADPDLPSFASGFGVPPVAPSHSDGEDDTSRLFWVPARLHPELAPKDYKSFVEDRVDRIKRTSGDEDALSPDSMTRTSSGDSSKVNRRKSMLSKTIELPQDLKDGADVLDRKRSGHQRMTSAETSLQELEALVSDPSEMVRKMSLDATRRSLDSNAEVPVNEDMPILPTPAGQTLKRSTRTQYRRGSLRKGEVLGRRNTRRGKDAEVTEQAEEQTPPVPDLPPTLTDNPLSRIQSEPIKVLTQDTSLGDRPRSSRQIRAEQSLQETASLDDLRDERSQEPPNEGGHTHPQPRPFQSRIARNGRTTAQVPGMPTAAIPQIIETPPSDSRHSLPPSGLQQRPERKSSHDFARSNSMPTSRAPIRSALGKPKPQPNQSLDEMASHPSPMPGTNTNTDALSFIPTLPEERKSDKRAKASKESGDPGSKKTSWGWLLGSEEKEREKEKKREEKEEREQSKKQKTKIKAVEKSYDSTRLDVLQTAADGARGRESIVLERDSNSKLEEERRKESNRRSGGAEGKKDKEPGIFSSLFGGSKKKADRDSGGKRNPIMRGLSPDPPRKSLRADIDYNWTRFSILEERAIYRMAHIKLANPRRALQSQVLLSNFMYSYLAKVQQMHPQIQIPQYQQKSQKQQRQEPAQKESDEYSAWQRYQEVRSHGPDIRSVMTLTSYSNKIDPPVTATALTPRQQIWLVLAHQRPMLVISTIMTRIISRPKMLAMLNTGNSPRTRTDTVVMTNTRRSRIGWSEILTRNRACLTTIDRRKPTTCGSFIASRGR